MTSPFLAGDIARDEGLRLNAYPDPESPRGKELAKPPTERRSDWKQLPGDPWTYGYGATRKLDGSPVREGDTITLEEASALLKANIAEAEACLNRAIPWWRDLSCYRQDVVANMTFNLGWSALSRFHHFLEALHKGDYEEAANEMLASLWARQVGERAKRLATQMRTGVRAA